MPGMPRPRPPYLLKETARGKTFWYVRRGDGPRIRIRGKYGSPEFIAAYEAAVNGAPAAQGKPDDGKAGTLAWLVARYRDSAAWAAYSPATRKQREAIFRQVIAAAGSTPYRAITRAHIAAGRDRRKDTPAQARHFLEAMGKMFAWAVDAGLAAVNPADGVERVKARKTGGFPVWTEAELAAFEARWPLGTRERLAFDVLLYTGLRRGDAVRIGRQHIRDGVIRIDTAKTGMRVTIPVLPALARSIEAGPTGDLALIVGDKGRPMVKEAFGNWFGAVCRAAGIKKSAHGLRKAGATRAANAGATVHELEALYGWTGGKMAMHYTQAADRERVAIGAAKKLEG